MLRFAILEPVFAVTAVLCAAQPNVRVEPTHLQTPRPLQDQTQAAAIRDYLHAWQTVDAAFDGNSVGVLDVDFVGTAREKLSEAVQQQAVLGLHTRYHDKSHDIQVAFYSPEGSSIQLVDDVEYDVQILNHETIQATQPVRARYIVVLTPAEARWRVRVFQAQPK